MENQENQQESTTNKTSPALWVSIILVIIVLAVGVYFLFIQGDTNNTNTLVNVNNPQNINEIINTNDDHITKVTDLGIPDSYTNNLLKFTVSNPDKLNYKEYNTDLSRIIEIENTPLACAVNYTSDNDLHPNSGEIAICFSIFLANSKNLSAWYDSYSDSTNSNHYLYESVTDELIKINEYSAIKEQILTGEHPAQPMDVGWFDGKALNYYFAVGNYILQIHSIVQIKDSALLQYTANIANSIEFK